MRVAVLIDADNIAASLADSIFALAGEYGEPVIRRAHGSLGSLQGWSDAGMRYAISARPPAAGGKNSADIALVIDALDILHGRLADVFCIVSSDRDFTGLAIRLREAGVQVIGLGEAKAPEQFRQACSTFWDISLPIPAVKLATSKRPSKDDKLRTAIRQQISALGGAKGVVDLARLAKSLKALPGISTGPAKSNWLKKALKGMEDVERVQDDPNRVRLKIKKIAA